MLDVGCCATVCTSVRPNIVSLLLHSCWSGEFEEICCFSFRSLSLSLSVTHSASLTHLPDSQSLEMHFLATTRHCGCWRPRDSQFANTGWANSSRKLWRESKSTAKIYVVCYFLLLVISQWKCSLDKQKQWLKKWIRSRFDSDRWKGELGELWWHFPFLESAGQLP